jgi:predicted ATPase
MPTSFSTLKVTNYRCLADLALELGGVNVFFGPNGAGKSTILDTIWLFRDCAIRGVEAASSSRSHGIGILWDRAEEGENVSISLSTADAEYSLRFGLSAGRIEPFAGERLRSVTTGRLLIDRPVGSDKAALFHAGVEQTLPVTLREPDKLSLGTYLDFNQNDREGKELDRFLHFMRLYHCRSFFLHRLRVNGSEAGHETRLFDRGDNLWSVLRNLHDRRTVDGRFDTIMKYMAESFPSFEGLRVEQTSPTTVYAYFREHGHDKDIYASGVSDGYLQQLLLLTALFSEGDDRAALLLFDEPEISLHPWPLAVFSRAVVEASERWNKQVLIATHSPVLLSQFDIGQICATELVDAQTRVRRLSEMDEIKDLLQEYAAGSLYMAELVGGQRPVSAESSG